jgi:1,4-dihydroxy-2-naphthoate octaprenyltransferase
MALTLNDWLYLVGMLAVCAFITYTVHEVGNAIWSYLDE